MLRRPPMAADTEKGAVNAPSTASAEPHASPVHYAFIIIAFLALNSGINMLNRWVLGVFGFRFPIFLTSCHLLQGFCILSPIMALPANARLHRTTLEKQGRGIAAVGVFKVANIALNNMSLVFLSLSLSQIIRSGIPVMTALLGAVIEKKIPTPFEVLSLLILTAGVVLSVWEGSVSGSAVGIGLSLASVLCGAAMLSFSGRALSEKLDVFRLTFYTAPVSLITLLPVLIFKEAGPLAEYWASNGSWALVFYLLSGGVIAMLYNLVHYRMIQITSATLTPVIGMIKVVGIVVLSAVFLGERDIFTVRMVIGCTLAVMGFGMYSYAAAEAQQRQHTVRVRPGQAAQGFRVGSDPGEADGAEKDENAPLLPTSTQASSGAWGTQPSMVHPRA